MYRTSTAIAARRQPDALVLGAATWLASSCVLLGLTPLPLHDATLGWSPLFWLLVAPAVLLAGRRWLCHPPTGDSRVTIHEQLSHSRRACAAGAIRNPAIQGGPDLERYPGITKRYPKYIAFANQGIAATSLDSRLRGNDDVMILAGRHKRTRMDRVATR